MHAHAQHLQQCDNEQSMLLVSVNMDCRAVRRCHLPAHHTGLANGPGMVWCLSR